MMTFKTLILATLITAGIAISSTNVFAENALETMRKNARIWAFDAAKNTMHLNKDNLEAEIRQKHKNYLSNRGCNTLMDALEQYGITEILNGKNHSMTAKFWDRQRRVEPLEQIELKAEAFNEKTGLYSWKVEIPLTLHFNGRYTGPEYNFRAIIDLEQTTDKKKPFVIDKWWTSRQNKGRNELIAKHASRDIKDRPICQM